MPTLYPLARAALFKLQAETAHEVVLTGLGTLPKAVRSLVRTRSAVRDPRLRTSLWGIDFENPVGLAAGLDKKGDAFNALGALGFGFVEIGTVTAHAQPGNPRPRLFRLPQDEALLNRMGFNNPGAEAMAAHLASSPSETVLGVNLGKSKLTPNEEAVDDYLRSIELLERFADYLVINVSSPNTPGLRDLQDAEPLRKLLRAVTARANASATRSPVLLKLAPDLTDTQLDEAVDIALEEGVSGIIATNTTISRAGLTTDAAEVEALGAGGISGKPVRKRALEVIARIYGRTQGKMPIIGVGGIFSAEDAWERIRAGADLIQLYTGFVYRGPALVREINEGLVQRLERAGLSSISEAVGTASRSGGAQ